ncbi:MAG: hypothetical protein AAGA30_07870 [Planctomycetota bacterium]
MSTFLVGMLTAYSRHVRQIDRAERMQVAVELTDQLLADWFRDQRTFSSYRQGIFENQDIYYWDVVRSRFGTEARFGAHIVTLRVFDSRSEDESPLLSVDLLDEVSVRLQPGAVQ